MKIQPIRKEEQEQQSAALKRVLARLTKAGITYHGRRTTKAGKHTYLVEYEGRKYTLPTYGDMEQFSCMVVYRKEYPALQFLTWKEWQQPGTRGIVESYVSYSEAARRMLQLLVLQQKQGSKE